MFHTTSNYTYPEVGTSGFAILTSEMVFWEILSLALMLCLNAASLYHTIVSLPVLLQDVYYSHTHTHTHTHDVIIF